MFGKFFALPVSCLVYAHVGDIEGTHFAEFLQMMLQVHDILRDVRINIQPPVELYLPPGVRNDAAGVKLGVEK